MTKDWTGNGNSIYKTLTASNHADGEREEHDYYATPEIAVEKLLEKETFDKWIWEPACGEGHISKALEKRGYDVISTDLIYRGYGEKESLDFLESDEKELAEDIITNPPYKYALEFVAKALNSIKTGQKVAMLLKIQFLEGKERGEFFKKNPPKSVYVFSNRVACALNGDFAAVTNEHGKFKSAACYAWFVWQKGFIGPCIVDWITDELRYTGDSQNA